MTSEEHRYKVKCTWDREKIVNVSISGKPDFKVATPPDFWPESPEDVLSPEDMFLASAVTCYGVSLSGVSKRYHAEFDDFEIEADGTLKQGEFGWEFDEINISAKIYVSSESDRKKMGKAAERAHTYCVVTNSMKCPVNLEFEIIMNE
ncbi:MAG: OsmC family protein [Candidatus Thorarchaeota archaeon]